MRYPAIYIRFEGNNFYPSRLKEKTKYPIKVLAEAGQIASKGRYKGKPFPYGIGVLEIKANKSKEDIYDVLQKYSSELLDSKAYLKESGVEEIVFDIETSKDFTSEISISAAILKDLSLLNARVEFHTINDTENLKIKVDQISDKFPSINKNELLQILNTVLHKHPLIFEADALSYIIYLIKEHLDNEEIGSVIKLKENLSKFEEFYDELIKE